MMMIVIPGRHLERKYQVLTIVIFGVRGIYNLSFKYPALVTLIFGSARHLEFACEVPVT